MLDHIDVSEWSLREGLLYDIVGRFTEEDPRDRTVRALSRRYHIDSHQAEQVQGTAARLLTLVADSWGLVDPPLARALSWAALLHEIGLGIAHVKYHEHGAYLLENSDLPGFGRQEQTLLAILVGSHRRKLGSVHLSHLPQRLRQPALRLVVLLRLAVLLNRSRRARDLSILQLMADGNNLEIKFPADWLQAKPQTAADLEQETRYLADIKIKFRVTTL